MPGPARICPLSMLPASLPMTPVAKAIPDFGLPEPDAALCKLMRNPTLRSLGGRPKWSRVGGVNGPPVSLQRAASERAPHVRNKHVPTLSS